MNAMIRSLLLVSVAASLLGGCAASGTTGGKTAYEKACRSPMMKGAAARQAYWCWQSVGAKSYEEWVAYESAADGAGDADIEVVASLPRNAVR